MKDFSLKRLHTGIPHFIVLIFTVLCNIAFFKNWRPVGTLSWASLLAFFQQHLLTSWLCVTFWQFSQYFNFFHYYLPWWFVISDLWCYSCKKITMGKGWRGQAQRIFIEMKLFCDSIIVYETVMVAEWYYAFVETHRIVQYKEWTLM